MLVSESAAGVKSLFAKFTFFSDSYKTIGLRYNVAAQISPNP